MFEDRQDEVHSLLSENLEFRRWYNKHQNLHKQVDEAESGVRQMDDVELHKLKKERLRAKDQLAKLLDRNR